MSEIEKKDILIEDITLPYGRIRAAERYIEVKLKEGASDEEIKNHLLSTGWTDHAIDVITHEVHILDDNVDKVEKFVQTCIEKGLPKEKIKVTLMNIGWREDIIDQIFDKFK